MNPAPAELLRHFNKTR